MIEFSFENNINFIWLCNPVNDYDQANLKDDVFEGKISNLTVTKKLISFVLKT